MLVLGIETSCDETAVGIVSDDADSAHRLRAHLVATQIAEHQPYGGVVPEIAARAHLDKLDDLIHRALAEARVRLDDLDGLAATTGPGLIGGVMVGAMTAKAMAAVSKLPFMAVNHLEAHALTARLSHSVDFPYLLLLVSGGHCQLLLVKGVGKYRRLGSTVDDAVGECFDKSAKLLGLGYPGGPLLERAAESGNPRAFDLPRPMLGRAGCDFSFSGLKTAVRQRVTAQGDLTPSFVADMAASLQEAIGDILADRVAHAFALLKEEKQSVEALVVGGGVAANRAIRELLTACAAAQGVAFIAPPVGLCTDNGVMVAWAGLERLRLGLTNSLDVATRPRWPLESM
ncbi:MAG: tRNA (adenosine(37)-N6)-threonylcarbamoyltransferase complex transferase subunit TsaD [Alphaproteobacteria bacterium]|nr:tRNA (adenosine(37)-N6)-threonylcarbamoyltransferase complex transferase subunit TsaD [Alphaproteobacteria bacterium]